MLIGCGFRENLREINKTAGQGGNGKRGVRSSGGRICGLAEALAQLDTFPKYLLANAERFGGRPAMRHKDYGIWQSWTWREQFEQVRALALGLQALGCKRGDKVAIVGANRPRLYWSFTAAQSLGAIPVPV